MENWFDIIIILPFLLILIMETYIYRKQRKIILEPIQKYVTGSKSGARGKIINLYNCYNKCSDREIIIQKHLLKVYSEQPVIVDRVVDLFAKLMFPLITFMLLFAMTWLTNVFQSINSKIDKDQLDKLEKNILNFQEIIDGFYAQPISYILAIVSLMTLASIISYIIVQTKSSFLKFHEDIIDKIIKERNIENSPLIK
ncbi:hypothetical protein [Paenibacillus thiaminolyticus]|uniref:MotA/TolQ/ExbB proton channel domain-containing protein n=1 Tax=Paenibacillus thiaminolyticus TaxID=49283 RepID=A0A3A3GQQ2_PANTH|nr:hypothetical protein [Paenibacillus thiaminolyticus]RJG26722.1 hypothetical protein DQX05_01430 [Paenibacillus thiaminolyticus]